MRRALLLPSLCIFLVSTTGCGAAALAEAPQASRAESFETTAAGAPVVNVSEETTSAMPAAAMAPPAPMPAAPMRAAPTGARTMSATGSAPPSRAAAKTAPAAPPPAPTPRTARSVESPVDVAQAPLVIYAGELQMMADEDRFASTIDKAIDVAESFGGYLGARRDASVQLRVPSAHFRDALTKLETLGAVVHRSVSASDVSEEVHDGEVRLKNLRATRTRLEDLLVKAPNVQDTLAVERELERIAQEMDVLEGRLQFLKSRAAFSQIDLALTAKPKIAPRVAEAERRYVALPFPWLNELGVDKLLTIR